MAESDWLGMADLIPNGYKLQTSVNRVDFSNTSVRYLQLICTNGRHEVVITSQTLESWSLGDDEPVRHRINLAEFVRKARDHEHNTHVPKGH